jgi:hypothetical protein
LISCIDFHSIVERSNVGIGADENDSSIGLIATESLTILQGLPLDKKVQPGVK